MTIEECSDKNLDSFVTQVAQLPITTPTNNPTSNYTRIPPINLKVLYHSPEENEGSSLNFSTVFVSANTITSLRIYSPKIILCNFGACSNSNTLNDTALSFDVIHEE